LEKNWKKLSGNRQVTREEQKVLDKLARKEAQRNAQQMGSNSTLKLEIRIQIEIQILNAKWQMPNGQWTMVH
jgi:hypothetical protein